MKDARNPHTPDQLAYSDYRKRDGVALAQAIRDGELSASAVLEAAIARAEAVNPQINALTWPLYERAREYVAHAFTGGSTLQGELAGVPFLLKNLHQEWAGTASTAGSRALLGVSSANTAEVVRRWIEAGLVVFGRTNTPEFGTKPVTEPLAHGATRNPWKLSRTSGGSSGGAAAAVAAGVVPLAGASDGGGSIRIPAACCGIFGLKAGRGLITQGPTRAESFNGASIDGVLSRTVRDSAAALDAIIGPDHTAPYAVAQPAEGFSAETERDPRALRIGFSAESGMGSVAPEARAALADAAELLESLGHHVEEVSPPVDYAGLSEDFLNAWTVQIAAAMDEVEAATGARPKDYELDTRLLAETGRSVSGPLYATTLARWHEHTRRLAAFHADYDLLLTPTLASPPVKVGALDTPLWLRVAGKLALSLRAGRLLRKTGAVVAAAAEHLRHVPYTQLANITGRPAMSVPLYWTPDGLPLGVQFVAPLAGEGTLFQLAGQLERARPWAHKEPPL